ncbi:unnamed protein product [Ambrosiozyma monospora]|uniref:Unnamed protein product n=1 Tax=Ambrosiozyma monospora TaxID=43982 RepID=A0ACB5TJA4_AMBMO|nr:unnamed protein product [Ambrosiozyma monospora]
MPTEVQQTIQTGKSVDKFTNTLEEIRSHCSRPSNFSNALRSLAKTKTSDWFNEKMVFSVEENVFNYETINNIYPARVIEFNELSFQLPNLPEQKPSKWRVVIDFKTTNTNNPIQGILTKVVSQGPKTNNHHQQKL